MAKIQFFGIDSATPFRFIFTTLYSVIYYNNTRKDDGKKCTFAAERKPHGIV